MAIGLAWTALGGEIMYVEATQMTGDGKLTLTGQLGDVMKESANLAMNWLRSNARRVSPRYLCTQRRLSMYCNLGKKSDSRHVMSVVLVMKVTRKSVAGGLRDVYLVS